MKRLIWLPIAGFLLVAGATVAAAAPAAVDSAKGLLGASTNPVTSGTITVNADSDLGHPGQDLLEETLADLVSQNVISQAQSDAITSALQTKVDARRAEIEAQREQMRQTREQVRGFLEDGVLTQDEINQLPEDNPLRTAFDSIAENGQVTLEQLRSLGPGFGFGHGGPGMRGHGPGFWFHGPDADANPNASPSPTTGASSDS
jgi:hypothetical protein